MKNVEKLGVDVVTNDEEGYADGDHDPVQLQLMWREEPKKEIHDKSPSLGCLLDRFSTSNFYPPLSYSRIADYCLANT